MSNIKRLDNTKRLVGIAIFSAIIIILQLFATFVKFGPFAITLALTPIVVGAAIYGMSAGVFLGGVFGLVTLIAGIFGWDPSTTLLLQINPVLTAALCIVKASAAGFLAGTAHVLLAKIDSAIGAITAAVICPLVNTGIFCIVMILFYSETLKTWGWSGDTSALLFIIGIIGVNFLLEFAVNVVLSPIIARIIKIKAKM